MIYPHPVFKTLLRSSCLLAACITQATYAAETALTQSCASLLSASAAGVEQAQVQVAQTIQHQFAPPETLPTHCEVVGKLDERTGVDGQTYAIRYHLRLPENWNGRFFFEGGGGTNGNLGAASGSIAMGMPGALARGYAVVSQDSGHSNELNSNPTAGGQTAFGHDPEARRNYSYASLNKVSTVAKQLINNFYGKPADYAYFVGCSKGGQEGLAFAQKFPDVFDGIVASAPGMSLPKAAVAQLHDVQAFGQLVKEPDAPSFPFYRLPSAFSPAQFKTVEAAVLNACDDLDGLKDGIVGNFSACSSARVIPALEAKRCGNTAEGCLTEQQILALKQSVEGPKDAEGKAIYTNWPWDAGIGSPAWQMWKLGNAQMPALNIITGASAMASMFTVPPTPVKADPQSLADYAMAFKTAQDSQKIYATSKSFTESAWQVMAMNSANLDAFKAKGGKLIVPHGVSDPVFSINDTLAWHSDVDKRYKGKADDFMRVFPVPGMAHCFGGPSTNHYDAFAALTNWVENGVAPDQIIAAAGPDTPWAGRTRPLCPHPKIARYNGSGSIDKAENFSCATP